MGDIDFNDRNPFIDQSSGGLIEGLIADEAAALFVAGTEIIPGRED